MRAQLLLFLAILFSLSSCTSYYVGLTSCETALYTNSRDGKILIKIPEGEEIIVKGKKNYRKAKYKNYTGWVTSFNLIGEKKYYKPRIYKTVREKSQQSNYTGGEVRVKGYYRKDGTYVRPHTRKKAKSKSYKRKKY